MTVHLVNPSHLSFGVGVITPRWLFVLAGATPTSYGRPRITDETLEPFDTQGVQPGDVVGIGIHTGNALRGYEIGSLVRDRGATVIFGGIHATLYPGEAQSLGGAHAVVRGDGDVVWPLVLNDAVHGNLKSIYEAGRVDAESFVAARWELLPHGRYMWGSVQTVRGCPKHCSFCSVWRTDGQKPRQRRVEAVVDEIVDLRRRGFRFIALADDNFYPVMGRLAQLPSDLVFFTQITMEAAEDTAFLDAMRRANIKGALVGVEAVTPEGLKDVYKNFNDVGEALIARLRTFREHGVHVLGSFIFGLPSDRPSTFQATVDVANRAGLAFAQFVMLTPYPGTLDFESWEKRLGREAAHVGGVPITRHWLIPQDQRPKVYVPHPVMSAEEIRARTQAVWDEFYSLRRIWARSRCTPTLRARLAFVLISKLYRQMYANTGIATDSARVSRANRWARLIARPCRRLFVARPLSPLARTASDRDESVPTTARR
jgi:radical SAM superfamily enzyme YgiQ (UPF0313 family)